LRQRQRERGGASGARSIIRALLRVVQTQRICLDGRNHQPGVLRLKSKNDRPGPPQTQGSSTGTRTPRLPHRNIALLFLGRGEDLNSGGEGRLIKSSAEHREATIRYLKDP
jgi:hypothetical protein